MYHAAKRSFAAAQGQFPMPPLPHPQRGPSPCLLFKASTILTVSWFWLKALGKRELRFVVSTHPYSGVYLVRLGRKRWSH